MRPLGPDANSIQVRSGVWGRAPVCLHHYQGEQCRLRIVRWSFCTAISDKPRYAHGAGLWRALERYKSLCSGKLTCQPASAGSGPHRQQVTCEGPWLCCCSNLTLAAQHHFSLALAVQERSNCCACFEGQGAQHPLPQLQPWRTTTVAPLTALELLPGRMAVRCLITANTLQLSR